MPNICPRCYSCAVTRVQHPSTPSISNQVGMVALGSEIARHLPIPTPFGLLAGGLFGSILGQAFEPSSQPTRVIFQCNDCQHVFG